MIPIKNIILHPISINYSSENNKTALKNTIDTITKPKLKLHYKTPKVSLFFL